MNIYQKQAKENVCSNCKEEKCKKNLLIKFGSNRNIDFVTCDTYWHEYRKIMIEAMPKLTKEQVVERRKKLGLIR